MMERRRRAIEEALQRAVGSEHPAELYVPADYVMQAKGKRLRPLLVALTAELYGGTLEEALPAAVSVEVFHNFTLVHDDIMDNAESRRGRPTVHEKWDESTAILVGDLLMGIAYEQLARLPPEYVPAALEAFSTMVRRLCEGQAMDMAFEDRTAVTLADYMEMIDGKTGALVACAMELGAISAGARKSEIQAVALSGRDIGRAFQIQDDLLDLTADTPGWGKQIGGDLLEGKRTWLLLSALERAKGADRGLLDCVLRGELTASGITEVRSLMDRLGVLEDTRDAVIFHSDAAINRLQAAPDSSAREELIGLIRSMQARLH